MKEKSNATLRRAASLRCRTDAAIARLKYVQRQPRMKSCKLSDVTRVTRINRSSWGETTPALYGYEIEARGKTFRLLAPRND